MKKLLAVLLAMIMAVSVISCGVTTNDETDFTEVDEIVYVVDVASVNVRKSPSKDGEIAGHLKEGDSVKRIGIGKDWSKVIFNDEECYIASNCLSTTKPVEIGDIEFEDVDEIVYVREGQTIQIRSTPDTASSTNVLGSESQGFSAKRTGVYWDGGEDDEIPTGWSRIEYTDKDGETHTAYTRSWYWTTEKVDPPAETGGETTKAE